MEEDTGSLNTIQEDQDEVMQAGDSPTDVDSVIQNAAAKANLSVHNVKSILHHVLKDKRVLSVVQAKAGEGTVPLDNDIIEPRLTRSKVREAVASTMSPDKIARMREITRVPTKPGNMSAEELLNHSLGTDDSSDEEYDPDKEGAGLSDSDEELPLPEANEREPTLSPMSTDTLQSDQASSTVQPSEEAIVQETAVLLASLSDVILSPIKTRGQRSQETELSQLKNSEQPIKGEIAQRTRSKFPLTDTPLSAIEGSFQPPDAEDLPTPLELDEDDLQWHLWLNDLMNPPELLPEEGEEDTEYHYRAEQDVVEREELRNDRAVKIPRREVDELLSELLCPPSEGLGGLLSGDGMDPTSAYLLESLGLQTPLLAVTTPMEYEATPTANEEEISCHLSLEQARQLSLQIRQHFQLLMQTFLLSRFEPSLVHLSQVAAQAVGELSSWSQGAEQGTSSAVWYVPDVRAGVEIINQLDPNNENAVTLNPDSGYRANIRVPEGAQELIMSTPLFWSFPALLPGVGFAPVTKDKATVTTFFSTAEDNLLVLGMDRYGTGSSAWQLIRNNLLPIKTIKQLQLRVKNQSSKRTGDNVIKHYKKTKEVKIPFNEGEEKPRDLPQWIIQYHKKRVEKEKEAKRMTEELTKQTAHLKKMLGLAPPTFPTTLLQATKRNLISTLEEAIKADKRPRVEIPNDKKKPDVLGCKRVRQRNTKSRKRADQQVLSQQKTPPLGNSLHQLLLAAGLKPNDTSARFAYSYISEVKRTLPLDGAKYLEFLRVLCSAEQEGWSLVKLFSEIQSVLGAWPHLVKLFTEFMEGKDCLEANAAEYKMEVANVKEFTSHLKERFSDSPLGLSAVLEQLELLDCPALTASMVEDALFPLVQAHEELVLSLRRAIHQLAPTHGGECEELVLSSLPDQFENIQLPQSTPPHPPVTMEIGSCEVETPPKSLMSISLVTSPQPLNTSWNRQEDSVILKQCLQAKDPGVQVFQEVGALLSRPQQEVEARYHELMELLRSARQAAGKDSEQPQ